VVDITTAEEFVDTAEGAATDIEVAVVSTKGAIADTVEKLTIALSSSS
jgi:hypothetical protein